MGRPAYPPEYDQEPPEDGILEYEIAIAACYDCRRIIGPTLSEDVGYEIHLNHEEHETEVVSTWTTVEILEDAFFQETRE